MNISLHLTTYGHFLQQVGWQKQQGLFLRFNKPHGCQQCSMKWNLFPSTLRGPRSTCDCMQPYLLQLCFVCRMNKPFIWTANLEKHIQVYSITEKFIIRKKIVPPSFQEPEQGWKVLTEKDWSELRKYNVTTKNGIYHKFSTIYIIDTFHTNIGFCQKISLTFIFEPWKDSKKLS